MLSFTMHLSSPPLQGDSFNAELAPIAIADYGIQDNQKKHVLITLKGVILENSANLLLNFFEDIQSLPVDRWLLQLQELRCISGTGLRNLARFTRILRRRGSAVEIVGIHKNVYYMLAGHQEVVFGQVDRHFLAPREELQTV